MVGSRGLTGARLWARRLGGDERLHAMSLRDAPDISGVPAKETGDSSGTSRLGYFVRDRLVQTLCGGIDDRVCLSAGSLHRFDGFAQLRAWLVGGHLRSFPHRLGHGDKCIRHEGSRDTLS